jgi:adenine phosphoribosyltransferase
MNRTVTLSAGADKMELSLPVCKIPGTELNIIAFDSMGDMKLIREVASLLDKALPTFDVLVCPEAKAIPIAQELCGRRGTDYFVLRKSAKLYMEEPTGIAVRSITTQKDQTLWYCAKASKKFVGKKVLLFDDVVSTGATLKVMNDFAEKTGLTVAARACVFAEGDAASNKELISLGYLPVLTDAELAAGK